jgi:RNA recognition motif-containing protein
MNKYFKFTVESDLGTGTQYIEFDENNWAIRQAECHEGQWFNSSRKKYHPELGGIALFDQQLTDLGMQRGEQIDAEEFTLAWKLSNRSTVSKSGRHSKQKYLKNLLIAYDRKEIGVLFTLSPMAKLIETSSHVYLNLKKFIQDGRDYDKIDPP